MSTKITKVVGKPVQVLKKVGKGIIEPAGKSNVYAIAGGVALSPIIGYGYSKFFDWIMSFIPNLPKLAKQLLKLFFPLIPVPILAKFKVPAGGVINGTLIGIFMTNVILTVYEMITGKSLSKVFTGSSGLEDSTASVSATQSEFGTF